MYTKYDYWIFRGSIDEKVCSDIIEIGTSQIEQEKNKGIDVTGLTGGNSEKKDDDVRLALGDRTLQQAKKEFGLTEENIYKKTYIRDSEITWLNRNKYDWIYSTIIDHVNQANFDAGWRYDIDSYDDIQFTTYRPGGFYGWHPDGGSDHFAKLKRDIPGVIPNEEKGRFTHTKSADRVGKIRKLSVTVNLNSGDEYMGGDLKFSLDEHQTKYDSKELIIEEAKQPGTVIVFPSYKYHCVTPITHGIRYSLVLWMYGRPFK